MDIDARLLELENRLRAAEDHLAILNLLVSYGPLVDSGTAGPASELWAPGGGYNFSGGLSGGTRLEAPGDLVSMYETEGHMGLVTTGVSHFTGTPKITIDGDTANAVGYSFVVLRRESEWFLWRAAINHWTLVRTDGGWRIQERFNRTLDGSSDSHETMRKVLAI